MPDKVFSVCSDFPFSLNIRGQGINYWETIQELAILPNDFVNDQTGNFSIFSGIWQL